MFALGKPSSNTSAIQGKLLCCHTLEMQYIKNVTGINTWILKFIRTEMN
jgi:hypothetical protein